MAGQTSPMSFMNINNGYISKKVTFDIQESLDEKIGRLISMMSKLTAQDYDHSKQFKPKIYQTKSERTDKKFLQSKLWSEKLSK